MIKVGTVVKLSNLPKNNFNGLLAVVKAVYEDGMYEVELLEKPIDFKPNWPINIGVFEQQIEQNNDNR